MNRIRLTVFLAIVAACITGCVSPEARRERSLSAAAAAAAKGDLERAAEILRLAQAYDPRDPLIATLLGQTYEEQGSFNRAVRLVESFPDDVQESNWLNLRARLLFHSGRYKEAARIAGALEQVAEVEAATAQVLSDIVIERRLAPEDTGSLPDAWLFTLAERLLDQGDSGTALSWMEQLSEEDSARDGLLEALMEHALGSDDPNLVRRVCRLIGPADTGTETLVHRRSLVLAEKKAEVARLDARFLASYPDHPMRGEILVAEARRRLSQGESEEALRLVDEALLLDGSDASALVLKGLGLEWSDRTEEAEVAFRTALALDPGNRMAREALRSMQKEPEAVIMRIESLEP